MARSDAMGCRELEGLLSLHASGDLAPDEARKVDSHLASCAPCRHEVEIWRRQAERLRDLRRGDAEAPIAPLFWKAIRKRIAGEPIPIDRMRARRSRQSWLAAAAALLLGAGISIAAFGLLGRDRPSTRDGEPAATARPSPGNGSSYEVPPFAPVGDGDVPSDRWGALPDDEVPDRIPL